MRPALPLSRTVAVLVLAVVAAYVAVALLPGPRRVQSGLEPPILAGSAVLLTGVAICRPRVVPYALGVAALVLAFAIHSRSSADGFVGWHVELLFPIGWGMIGSSVWSWRAAIASYIGVGIWTLFLTGAPEGIAYFDGPLYDADQLVFSVLVPIAVWPYLTFGMLGLFGIRFW